MRFSWNTWLGDMIGDSGEIGRAGSGWRMGENQSREPQWRASEGRAPARAQVYSRSGILRLFPMQIYSPFLTPKALSRYNAASRKGRFHGYMDVARVRDRGTWSSNGRFSCGNKMGETHQSLLNRVRK